MPCIVYTDIESLINKIDGCVEGNLIIYECLATNGTQKSLMKD